MSYITVKSHGETLFTGKEYDDEYVFSLDEMGSYDWYEESVRTVLSDFAYRLDGPTVARLLFLLSKTFLDSNREIYELSSEELRKSNG